MINALYEHLPECVDVCGKHYPIVTDFRDWIAFSDMLEDPNALPRDKIAAAMSWFDGDVPQDAAEALAALKAFFVANALRSDRALEQSENRPEAEKRRTLSYRMDAAYIIADFKRYYNIDLIHIKYLHYWEFRLLMQGLPDDCQVKKRIAYRSTDLVSIKDPAERNRIRRIQVEIAIDTICDDDDIADAFL